MTDPDKIEMQVTKMKDDVHNWKMGLKFKNCNETEFKTVMENDYEYLKNSSKTLFKNVLNNSVDNDNLTYLLKMLRLIKNNDKTNEQAEKEIGEKFANEYIKPLVNKFISS